jgi:hypothetical protein
MFSGSKPKAALPLLAILLLGTAVADPLPPGVQRQGNVITMQPIGDSDTAAAQDTDAARRPGMTDRKSVV